ncbi:smr domain-containing protein [Moniliophthora roreri MCA 2997]|uniref:Smr domain-containing protein n=1 Tax=Moniliophthora roreri (strain MCA 2997) TaxID=1381753 RepID=V2X8X4_MONRO|nr:smr domain-containing protein [Moniliophthora roreri MCA 2997]
MGSTSTIFDIFQKEFCPPLDSTLVAAILLDIDSDDPPREQIDRTRATLKALAAEAELAEQFSDSLNPTITDDTCSLSAPSLNQGDYSTSATSNSSIGSEHHSISSPLNFLQAALPHISSERLQKALVDASEEISIQTGREKDFDMWELIAGILTEESIRELEERGLNGLDDEDGIGLGVSLEDSWEKVGNRKTKKKNTAEKKKSKPKKTTITDIRQQQHVRPSYPRSNSLDTITRSAAAPDPWTQVSSISAHLATLLPTHSPSFFQPYFHSPDYATPYEAVLTALQSIVKAQTRPQITPASSASQSSSSSSSSVMDSDTDQERLHDLALISMLEVLLPSAEYLDSQARSRLISDAELALNATQDRADDALDLVQLLQELADDNESYLEMGVYHTQPPTPTREIPNAWGRPLIASPSAKSGVQKTPTIAKLPDGPPPAPPPPLPRNSNGSKDTQNIPGSKNKPSPYQWQAVKRKTPYKRTAHPLAAHIPAYERDVNGMKTVKARMKVAGNGNGIGKGGKGDVRELIRGGGEVNYRQRVAESLRRRNEMLREASKMWQRGNRKTRGGEVALYFAERAREFQEMAKKDSLDAARIMVESKRLASSERDTIDLHGTTVAEGTQIVKENLQAMSCSPSKPLKIITGRGTHSAGQVSVLKPALRKALVEDGWHVTSWDGGLVVKGKKNT